jgi:hypothetical protein
MVKTAYKTTTTRITHLQIHLTVVVMYFHPLFVVLSGTITLVRAANSWIVPGAEWRSTANVKIDAHGGMVIQDGDTFYWVGQAVSDRM